MVIQNIRGIALPSYYPNAVEMCRSLSAIYGSYTITRASRIKKEFFKKSVTGSQFLYILCNFSAQSTPFAIHGAVPAHSGVSIFFYSFPFDSPRNV